MSQTIIKLGQRRRALAAMITALTHNKAIDLSIDGHKTIILVNDDAVRSEVDDVHEALITLFKKQIQSLEQRILQEVEYVSSGPETAEG